MLIIIKFYDYSLCSPTNATGNVSFCHIARCVCRRAERIVVELNDNEHVNQYIMVYLNRLSDYLFVLARKLTLDNNGKEIPWIKK